MRRFLFAAALIALATGAFAQKVTNTADVVVARQMLKLMDRSVTQISYVVNGSSTHSQLITAKGVYDYAILKAKSEGATSGQVLKWNGSAWVPADDNNTGTTYTEGTGIDITGPVISNTGDTNAADDITTSSTAGGDVGGPFSNLQVNTGALLFPDFSAALKDTLKLVVISSVSEFANYPRNSMQNMIFWTDANRGGWFYLANSGTADGGTVFAGASSKKWIRFRPAGFCNVKWWGAVGDGSTDDATAMDQALDKAVSEQGTYYLPDGIFYSSAVISDTLDATRLTILGNGSATTTIKRANSVLSGGAPSVRVLRIFGKNGATVVAKGLTVDGNAAGQPTPSPTTQFQQAANLSFSPLGDHGFTYIGVEDVRSLNPLGDGVGINGSSADGIGQANLVNIYEGTRTYTRSSVCITANFDLVNLTNFVGPVVEVEPNGFTGFYKYVLNGSNWECTSEIDLNLLNARDNNRTGTCNLTNIHGKKLASLVIQEFNTTLTNFDITTLNPMRMAFGSYHVSNGILTADSAFADVNLVNQASANPTDFAVFSNVDFRKHSSVNLDYYYNDDNAFGTNTESIRFINCRFMDSERTAGIRSGKFVFQGCFHTYTGSDGAINFRAATNKSGITNELHLVNNVCQNSATYLAGHSTSGNEVKYFIQGNTVPDGHLVNWTRYDHIHGPKGSGSIQTLVTPAVYYQTSSSSLNGSNLPNTGKWCAGDLFYYAKPVDGYIGVVCDTSGNGDGSSATGATAGAKFKKFGPLSNASAFTPYTAGTGIDITGTVISNTGSSIVYVDTLYASAHQDSIYYKRNSNTYRVKAGPWLYHSLGTYYGSLVGIGGVPLSGYGLTVYGDTRSEGRLITRGTGSITGPGGCALRLINTGADTWDIGNDDTERLIFRSINAGGEVMRLEGDASAHFAGNVYVALRSGTATALAGFATSTGKMVDVTPSSELSLSSGTLKLAQQSASSGDVLKWNGSAWAPATDNSGTGDILNGGNTTGATMHIGSNDNQDVVLEANNSPVATLDNGGDLFVENSLRVGAPNGTAVNPTGFDNTGYLATPGLLLYTSAGESNAKVSSSTPSAPADGVTHYVVEKAGRDIPSWMGEDGVPWEFGESRATSKFAEWSATGNGTGVATWGLANSETGTATTRNVASTNLFTSVRRIGYVTAASSGSGAGTRHNNNQYWRGNAAGLGGFYYVIRFGMSTANSSNEQMFVGVRNSTSVIAANTNPSSLTNCIGFGIDATQTTMRFIYNDGSGTATTTNLGANFPTNSTDTDWYEARIYATPNAGTVYYHITNLSTGNTASGSTSSDLPSSTTLLCPHVYVSNGTDATAVGIDVSQYTLITKN